MNENQNLKKTKIFTVIIVIFLLFLCGIWFYNTNTYEIRRTVEGSSFLHSFVDQKSSNIASDIEGIERAYFDLKSECSQSQNKDLEGCSEEKIKQVETTLETLKAIKPVDLEEFQNQNKEEQKPSEPSSTEEKPKEEKKE